MADATSPPAVGRVALVRHGQTTWSASGQHTSVTDIPLTPVGEQQAEALPAILAGLGIRPGAVWCSPRQRAGETARLAGLRIDRIDDDLAEWDYGGYEGLTTAAIRAARPGWQLFTDGCPDGESPDDIRLRADRLLARAADQLARLADGADLVMVCHGHISRALAVRWVGLPVAAGALLAMDPAAVTVLGEAAGERIIQHANVIAAAAIAAVPADQTNGAPS